MPALAARAPDEQVKGQPEWLPAPAARADVRPPTLAHELSTLDAARGMLARGDASGALARLDGYGRAYPHGRLALEAEVLRIDALDAAAVPTPPAPARRRFSTATRTACSPRASARGSATRGADARPGPAVRAA